MIRNASIGGALWLAILVTSRLAVSAQRSWIEMLLLFAVLVIVPLGLAVSRKLDRGEASSGIERIAFQLQLPAALLAVCSFYARSRPLAAGLTIPWMLFAAMLAIGRGVRALTSRFRNSDADCAFLSFAYLLVGSMWLFASRAALRPMNFDEPIVLLTAVHFHYAGFATAMLARAQSHRGRTGTAQRILFPAAAAGALAGPALLATGFVAGPALKLAAAIALAAGEIALAICFAASATSPASGESAAPSSASATTAASAESGASATPIASRLLLAASAASVVVAMCLAAAWALGEFQHRPFLDISRMAAWHGALNAFGFTFCGLASFAAMKFSGQLQSGGAA